MHYVALLDKHRNAEKILGVWRLDNTNLLIIPAILMIFDQYIYILAGI